MSALLLCLVAVTARGIGDRPVILDGATDPYASEFVFFGTGYGIYTYSRTTAAWSRITTANGLPDNRARVIALDDGILWVATASGLASADVRINDWQTYALPGETRALAFDDKYAWAGGDSGLRRFDKYAETWTVRSDIPVNDLFAEKGLLWIASPAGVLCWDVRYDRVDEMPAPPDTYDLIINTPSRVWFSGRKKLVAYNKAAGSWAGYGPIQVEDFATLGDSVFLTSHGYRFIYEPGADAWAEIHEAEEVPPTSGIFVLGSEMLLATNQGLIIYNRKENTRTVWSRTNGLTTDTLVRVYADAQLAFVVSAGDIQTLDRQKGTWRHEDLVPPGTKKQKLGYIDDAGAHLRLVPDTDIRLSGRASYSDSRTFSSGQPTRTFYENVALNLAAQHRTGRILSGYYDDSDPDQVAYGLGYRGVGNDLLHRVNAGRLQTEYADFDLIPRFTDLGANARLVLPQPLTPDPRTLTVDVQAGKLQSELHVDYFTGRSVEKQVSLRDVDYAKGIFFRVPSVPPVPFVADTIFSDDRTPATNTVRTRTNSTVGGYTGDFDPLVSGIDYFPDYTAGVIHFLSSHKTGELLLLATNSGVQVIQTEADSTNRLKNTYLVGQDITPGTFELRVTDTAGADHPLAEFGIDNDGDGRVDPEYINHRLGLLSFPRPLTPNTQPLVLTASFQSQSVFYSLQYYPVVKNSERVTVDAEPMTRGSDYVMDYTSGILLFLRRDIVSDFSQIDVQYSSLSPDPSPSTSDPFLLSAQPNFTLLSSPFSLLLAPGFTRIEDENVIHLSGRAETGTGTDKSLRFVPQVAVNTDKGLAHDYRLTANYGIASAAAGYRGFSENYGDFGAADRRYGLLRHAADISAGVEPLRAFRLDGTYRREYQQNTLASLSSLSSLSGKLSYLNPKYPNGYVLVGQDKLPDNDKLRVKGNANYEFSLLKSRFKLNGIVQSTSLDHLTTRPLDHSLEYIAEATFSLPFPVNGSVRFRQNDLTGSARSREREVYGRLGADVVPGLYYTGSYNLLATGSRFDAVQDLQLGGYFYNNFQLAPGRWWSRLSIVNLSFGTGSNFNEYARNLDPAYAPPFLLLSPLSSLPAPAGIASADDLRSLYGTLQVQPFTALTLRAKRSLNRSGTAYYGLPDLTLVTEDELRAEYEPGKLGLFTALWNRKLGASFPQSDRQNVYFEWNMPWSQLLRTRLTSGYTTDEDKFSGAGTALSRQLNGNAEAQFNFNSRSYATIDFGASRQQVDSTLSGSSLPSSHSSLSLLPGAGLSLNLFRFLYLQLNYQSNFVLSGTATHTLSTRITGQF